MAGFYDRFGRVSTVYKYHFQEKQLMYQLVAGFFSDVTKKPGSLPGYID